MNVNLQANACDPARVELFLSGDLTSAQQREFTLHLDTCDHCRRSLHEQAAEPEGWIEAEKLLKPSEFDSFNADEVFGSGFVERSARQPIQIQAVLNALAPTDDPQMLGRLGGYEISGVVGAGGMGVVLKAIDKSLDRTVAIKVLAPHLAASGAARKRFAREAKAAAAVLHPNVIAIHSVSNDEALPYLVMPYLRGTSLQKRLDEEGPLSLHEILRIGSQIAAGLAAAHAQGLVHRDIKPANILLEQGVERVAITDFGLARAVDDATITHSGVIAGTPQYMSPEQARGEPVDGRSDLFSLGSVLYAICTGRPPFRAETTHGVMRRITDDEPTPIREINPDIPDWLCSIIRKLMAKKATDRFGSAAEVTQLLEECLAHVQQPAAVPLPHIPFSVPAQTASRANPPTKRYRKGVIAMVAALGFLGMALWLSADAPDISGRWTGAEWGEVALEQKEPGAYQGTYSDTFGKEVGGLELTWSRIERRFKGTWREGKDRFGKISVRMVGDEIRGAWTTNDASRIQPGNPELADLTWKRTETKNRATTSTAVAPSPARASSEVAFGPVVEKILIHDGKAGTPSVFLDLDTGRSASMELKAGRKAIFRWAREAGMDLEFTGFSPNEGLLGWRLLVRAVDEGKWDEANANELLNEPALADNMRPTRSTGDALSPSITDPNEWDLFAAPKFFKSGTYYFRTNEDGRGILRVSVSEEQPGVSIRYKLLQRPDQKRDSVSTGDSTAPTQPSKPETPVVGTPVNAADPPPPPAGVLTASQVVEQGNALYHSRKKVTVRFRVESVTHVTQRDGQGKESKWWNLGSKAASDRVDPTAFSVRLSPEAEAALDGRGVSNIARHYFGRLIEVEGVVYGVGLDVVFQPETIWTYHMDVNSLDQIRLVDSAPKQPDTTAATPGRMNYFTSGHGISIASSADGKLIAVANANPTRILMEGGTSRVKGAWKPTVDILEIETGKVVVSSTVTDRDENAVLAATPRISHFEVTALAFSPVENLLAVGTSIGQVKLFDARTGRLIQSFDDERAKLAEKDTPEHWKLLRFAMGHVGSLAFSPDGTLLATCGSSFSDSSDGFDGVTRLTRKTTGSGRVKVWDVKTAKLKHDLVGHSYANTVAFSSDGNLLASAGSWLASGGDGHGSGVILWNPQTGEKMRTITNEANLGTRSVAFLPDSETVLICSDNYDKEGATTTATISLANAGTGTIQRQHKVPGGASKVLSPDGKTILVLTGKSIQFLDAETGAVKREIKSDNLSKDGQLGDFALLRPWLVIGTVDDEEGNVELRNLGDDVAAAMGSSETKVRILSMGSSSSMLDLDTGKTMNLPARTGQPEQGKMDVHTDQWQPYHYPKELIGVELQGREVKAGDWSASAADVRRALAGRAVGPLKQMDIGPEKNPTYFFKTRDGAYGVLQLLGIVEESKGIRLRYKVLGVDRAASGAQKASAVQPGIGDPIATRPTLGQTNVTPGPSPDAQLAPQPNANSAMPKRTYHIPAGDIIETIAVAPDGSLIAFGNGNPTLVEHTNGTIEVTDNWKPTVKIVVGEPHFGERGVASLNLTTSEERGVLAATRRVSYFEVTALAFSPDASLLAVGTSIGQVKLYNTKTAELVRVLDDEKARLADKDTPENWKSLARAIGSVASLAFSPDGSLLAVCGTSFEDYSDIFDGIERTTLKTTGPGRLKVFDVKTGTLKHDLVGHSHAYDVAFSPEGGLLVSAGDWSSADHGNGVNTWNAQTGKKISTIVKEANAGVHSVAFSPNRKIVAIGARQYDKENDTYSTAISLGYPMSGITDWQQTIPGHALPKAFTPDGKNVAVLCDGQSIRFIDVENGQLKHEIKAADSPGRGRLRDFAIAPKGQLLVIGRADGEHKGSVEIWEFDAPPAADDPASAQESETKVDQQGKR